MAIRYLDTLLERPTIKGIINYVTGKDKLEKTVDAEFVDKLKELPFTVAAKKNLGGGNNLNEPDWFICVRGRLLIIETKRPKGIGKRGGILKNKNRELREGQRIRAKWWQRAGAKYVICTNADDMIQAVNEIYREQLALENQQGEDLY